MKTFALVMAGVAALVYGICVSQAAPAGPGNFITNVPPGVTTNVPPGATTNLPPGASTNLPPGVTTNLPPGVSNTPYR